jgi:hypothetical protein
LVYQSGNLQRIVDKINTLRVFLATQGKEDEEKEKEVIETGFWWRFMNFAYRKGQSDNSA